MRPAGGLPTPVGPSVSTSTPVTSPTSAPGTPATTPATGAASPTAIPTISLSGDPALADLSPATGPVTGETTISYLVNGVIHDGTTTISIAQQGQAGAMLARLAG